MQVMVRSIKLLEKLKQMYQMEKQNGMKFLLMEN